MTTKFISPDFLIIPYHLIKDQQLEPNDRLVYAIVYWFEHLKDGKCIASNNTIANILLITPRSVQNSLTKLEEGGYIQRIYKDASNRHRKEIKTKVAFRFVRSGGDTKKQSEPVVTLERTLGDTQSEPVVTRVYNREYRIEDSTTHFEVFWEMYPRKVEKKKAEMKWQKLPEATKKLILEDLPKRKESQAWKKDGGMFVPYPTTYLNGERWNDEIKTTNYNQRKTVKV